MPFLQISLKNSEPPTIPFGTVAGTFSDNLSRNSCIYCLDDDDDDEHVDVEKEEESKSKLL